MKDFDFDLFQEQMEKSSWNCNTKLIVILRQQYYKIRKIYIRCIGLRAVQLRPIQKYLHKK